MKIKKIFLSLIVSLSLIFSNIFVVPVSAANITSWLQPIIDVYNSVDNAANITADALKQSFIGALQGAGFIFDAGRVTTQALIDFLRGYNNGQFTNNNTASDQEVIDNAARYFINNTVLTDNSIEYNSNSKNLTVGLANDIINNSGYRYVYSARLIDHINDFSDGTYYNALRQFMNDHSNDFIYIRGIQFGGSVYVGSSLNPFVLDATFPNLNVYFGYAYGYSDWEKEVLEFYSYDSVKHEFVRDTSGDYSPRFGIPYTDFSSAWYSADWNWFSLNDFKVAKLYYTLNDLKADSIGIAPFYISDKWRNFVNSNNSTYTVDSSNSNNITYGDTNNWITNYYTDNGIYPDPTQISVYIDNNIPPSPSPTPTPGPDDPGGGSGGSGGNGGIDLGWLGTLGQLIGQIVSAIGNFFTGVLQGIVNALTSVLGFLSDTISSLGETLPTAFFDFIGSIFGWLPDPMMNTLKSLFLMMVLVGVISIFRR